jgi:AhpD family alkylhydroperoxidase
MRLARFSRLVQHQPPRELRDAVHVAGLVAAMADDCGSCVQIGVNLSRRAGVDRHTLAAVVERRPEELSSELQDVYHFADAVVHNTIEQEELREQIKQHYGEKGLVEIALAIAFERTFPTLKRGLGYAKSCSRVTVAV